MVELDGIKMCVYNQSYGTSIADSLEMVSCTETVVLQDKNGELGPLLLYTFILESLNAHPTHLASSKDATKFNVRTGKN